MRYLLIAAILFCWVGIASAGTIVVGQPAAAVGEEPASGTVIIGSSTTSDASQASPNANNEFFWNVDFPASWSESASTTTVATIEWYLQGWAGGNCKAILLNSDGTILTNGVSNALAIEYSETASWHSFTMGTPPTVTKSTNYKIAIVCNADVAIQLNYNGSGTQTFGLETTSTSQYTTPTAVTIPPDSVADDSATVGGVRAKH